MASSTDKSRVWMGTCGWTSDSLLACKRFYPPFVRTTLQQLHTYGQHFPCVEVDTSNYAIPSPFNVEKWVANVPAGFLFHVKAYCLFTAGKAQTQSIPRVVREKLPPSLQAGSWVSREDLSPELLNEIWQRFKDAFQPALNAGKLGVVLCQFQTNWGPTPAHRQYLKDLRTHLPADTYKVAVEFRNREWFAPTHIGHTMELLRSLNYGCVTVDELAHELNAAPFVSKYGQDRALYPHEIMPMEMRVTTPDYFYIRVHRREGTHRLFSDTAIQEWADRIFSLIIEGRVTGPVYMLWGTDHEDQSIVNARNLSRALGLAAFDWAAHILTLPGHKATLKAFFVSGDQVTNASDTKGEPETLRDSKDADDEPDEFISSTMATTRALLARLPPPPGPEPAGAAAGAPAIPRSPEHPSQRSTSSAQPSPSRPSVKRTTKPSNGGAAGPPPSKLAKGQTSLHSFFGGQPPS